MSNFERFGKQIAEGTAKQALYEKSIANFATRNGFPNFYRYIVLDVVFDPSIVDDKKISYWQHELGVTNIKFANSLPRNTIIAQRVLEAGSSSFEQPMFLFPFFPPTVSFPCNPGEHVWVMFENIAIKNPDLGWWFCRITVPGNVDDVNHTHLPRIYDENVINNSLSTSEIFEGKEKKILEFPAGAVELDPDGNRRTVIETLTISSDDEKIYEKIMTESDGGKLRHYEPVPRYRKRPGDTVFEGTNNSLVVLGRHRVGPVAEYEETEDKGKVPSIPEVDLNDDGAAMIDIVVGRGQTKTTLGTTVENSLGKEEIDKQYTSENVSEGDPDLLNDRTRVAAFQKVKIDQVLELADFNSSVSISNVVDENGDGAILLKTDKIRIIARSDIEFLVSGYERDENGNMVSSTDTSKYAAIVIKSNGDIVFRPSEQGFIKLGGDDAKQAIVCTNDPANLADGQVDKAGTPPLVTTMGGLFANNVSGQGTYSTKVLIK